MPRTNNRKLPQNSQNQQMNRTPETIRKSMRSNHSAPGVLPNGNDCDPNTFRQPCDSDTEEVLSSKLSLSIKTTWIPDIYNLNNYFPVIDESFDNFNQNTTKNGFMLNATSTITPNSILNDPNFKNLIENSLVYRNFIRLGILSISGQFIP